MTGVRRDQRSMRIDSHITRVPHHEAPLGGPGDEPVHVAESCGPGQVHASRSAIDNFAAEVA